MLPQPDAGDTRSMRARMLVGDLYVADQAAAGSARRPRRYDPDRRGRIVAAALEVIADQGVAGASHRAIARTADVPLGSTTYHFATLDELLAAAFTAHAEATAAALERRMHAADDPEAALEALAGHLTQDLLASGRTLVLAVELYLAAARRPSLRAVTQAWMLRSRCALEVHFDPVTARELDALIEGLVLHQALSTHPMTGDQLRHALHRITS
ncbi:TetR/AcrR family transcriptional regulator [Peterkaempfera sp. SMS 1(5)a]|uniref:TetR/AcrR family transcriptional regulator n=1 Tax=Peterkaempfera podocarpi TaxID=3232308 RepID=UPI00366A8590